MAEQVIKLPDIGEGIAEAEISEWAVAIGEWINEDDIIGVVLTDKAAVEIPSSASGKVVWRAGEPGDMLPIGAPLVKIETAAQDDAAHPDPAPEEATPSAEDTLAEADQEATGRSEPPEPAPGTPAAAKGKARAAPAVRKRAADLGIDLSRLSGTGPEGRVIHADLDRELAGAGTGIATPARDGDDGIHETKIIGLRRKIAEQMSIAHARIPQITIVEEIDVTELERLRSQMNADRAETSPKLTLLPFLIRGVVAARTVAPQVNARFDDEAGTLSRYDAVHFGIATQTESGLVVPVLRHADARTVPQLASEIVSLAAGARAGTLSREELAGSTITVTSLGPLGAIATTPIINHPEVAIVGVNRKQVRPQWDGRSFVPREMMNLSASFDHRIVDGWDAATFIARLKVLLETPALLFA
ncbi:dihydrolipoamide acetyltransferase family protein [Tropicimonas marinistellae]|uniref:dihydrolipoamide acetyltransferase family protein n=1 Tax=Tropicimonas marinistellae TaxID=1739787 RepID=UPI00082D482D|nr:dihydrolipoamide acetyltransferase family protein [Tropicimonas marinistellae]